MSRAKKARAVRAKQTWTRAELNRAVSALQTAKTFLTSYREGFIIASYQKASLDDTLQWLGRVEDTFSAGRVTLPYNGKVETV